MINMFLKRFYNLSEPAISLSDKQQDALQVFRHKLDQGVYSFEQVLCLCGSEESRLIAKRDRYALPTFTHLCKSCGLLWTSPRLTEDSLTKFYEEDYRSLYLGHAKANDDFFADQIQRGTVIYNYIASNVGALSTNRGTIFDIGCGAGGLLVPFVEAGWRAFGCDPGDEYLERGRQAGLALEHGDAHVLEKHGKAQLILLNHVLEHLPHPGKSLRQVSQMLVEGGYLYIEVPGVFYAHRTHPDFIRYLHIAHLYHFTLFTLTSLMSRAGFRLVKGDEHIHALFQKDADASLTLLPNQYSRILRYIYFAKILSIMSVPVRSSLRVSRRILGSISG